MAGGNTRAVGSCKSREWTKRDPALVRHVRRGKESRPSSLSYLNRLPAVLVVIASGCFAAGCIAAGDEFELSWRDPAEDQLLIAERYSEEALRFYQKAEEAEARAAIYADLFGVDSDW
jgi:hypothetical protein